MSNQYWHLGTQQGYLEQNFLKQKVCRNKCYRHEHLVKWLQLAKVPTGSLFACLAANLDWPQNRAVKDNGTCDWG
jgi:hypothetical protein